jgi:hypothetical protein
MNKLNQTILAGMMANIFILPAIASPATPSPVSLNGAQLQNIVYVQDKSSYLTQEDMIKERRSHSYGYMNLMFEAVNQQMKAFINKNTNLARIWSQLVKDLEALDLRYEFATPENFDYVKFNFDYHSATLMLPFAISNMRNLGYINDAEALELSKFIMMPVQLMLDNKSSFELWDMCTWEDLEEDATKFQAMVDSGEYKKTEINKYIRRAQECVVSADPAP